MAGFSWSNPEQDKTNPGSLPLPALHTGDIGGIVAAILRAKEQANQNSRQDYQAMLSGIGKGVSGYANAQAQGEQNDAANAAMYGMQYPNDPYGGFTDPNRVPDYGGTDAAKLQLEMQKVRTAQIEDQLRNAQTSQTWAHANQMWNNPSGDAGSPAQPQTFTDDQGREWRQGTGGQWFPMSQGKDTSRTQMNNYKDQANAAKQDLLNQVGVPATDLSKVMDALNSYQPGTTAFPALGGTHTAPITDDSQGQYKDAVLSARQRYQQALANISGGATSTKLPPSVSQNDVNQVSEAPPAGSDIKSPSGVNMPKQGDVVRGYKFLGGDPADKNNWEKVE